MACRKTAFVTSILVTLVPGSVLAAQVPYATFTGAGAVSNFTALSPEGTGCTGDCEGVSPVLGGHGYVFGATNNVTFTWDGTVFTSSGDYTGPGGASNATISSPTSFLGLNWTMHGVQIFGPGTYSFDTSAGSAANDFETGVLGMTVGAGQLGVHMLMNWNTTQNIDIVNVWNLNATFSNCASSTTDIAASNCLYTGIQNPAGNSASTVFLLASTDNDGDGTLGIPMSTSGPYGGGPFAGFNFSFNMQGSMTVVPIPAAVWLFGSGLLGLVGMTRRKKKI